MGLLQTMGLGAWSEWITRKAKSISTLSDKVDTLEQNAYDVLWLDYWGDDVAGQDKIEGYIYAQQQYDAENGIYIPLSVEAIYTVVNDTLLEIMGANTIPIPHTRIYIDRTTNLQYSWSGSIMVALTVPLVFAKNTDPNNEVELANPTEDTKVITVLSAFKGFKFWLANTVLSTLNTTAKNIIGAINELIPTATNQGSFINSLTEKSSLVDADEFIVMDSADSNKAKKHSKSNLKIAMLNQTPRTVALSAFDIDMALGEDFTKLTGMGSNQTFTISNPIIKKKFRLFLTGGTLAVPTFTGYTTTWMASTAVTDYVPANTNVLYCEIRSAGTLNLFWGE